MTDEVVTNEAVTNEVVTDEAVTDDEAGALAAAEEIVRRFGAHDVAGYFDLFAPSATFVFHTTATALGSREEYCTLWRTWEEDGFRVLSCTSSERQVTQVAEGVVVFTHRVATRVADAGGVHDLDERESIVLRRESGGGWLAVHEHLSPTLQPAPQAPPGTAVVSSTSVSSTSVSSNSEVP